MAKNNGYSNYILNEQSVNYSLLGYDNRELSIYKHKFINDNEIRLWCRVRDYRSDADGSKRNKYFNKGISFYSTTCDECKTVFWRKKSYDNYKRSICSHKCQGEILTRIVQWRTFDNPGINSSGYPCFKLNGEDITCHRYVVEQSLGRKLRTDEIIHHKDMDKMNYSLDNLELLSKQAHQISHGTWNKLCKHFIDIGLVEYTNQKYIIRETT